MSASEKAGLEIPPLAFPSVLGDCDTASDTSCCGVVAASASAARCTCGGTSGIAVEDISLFRFSVDQTKKLTAP